MTMPSLDLASFGVSLLSSRWDPSTPNHSSRKLEILVVTMPISLAFSLPTQK